MWRTVIYLCLCNICRSVVFIGFFYLNTSVEAEQGANRKSISHALALASIKRRRP